MSEVSAFPDVHWQLILTAPNGFKKTPNVVDHLLWQHKQEI